MATKITSIIDFTPNNCSIVGLFNTDNTNSSILPMVVKSGSVDDILNVSIAVDKTISFTGGSVPYGITGSTRIVNDGQDHQFICTFDGTDWKIYIDGQLDTTLSDSTTLTNEDLGVLIGNNGTDIFDGAMRDVKVYNTILSQTDVTELYGALHTTPIHAITPVKQYNDALVTTFVTTSTNQSISIPAYSVGTFDGEIDWGDGTVLPFTAYNDPNLTHIFADIGDHQISITGTFTRWYYTTGSYTYLKSVDNFGATGFTSLAQAFRASSRLESITAGDSDLSAVTSMDDMCNSCTSLTTVDFSNADLNNVTIFNDAFTATTNLNEVILDGATFGNHGSNSGMFTNAGSHTISMLGTTFTGSAYKSFTSNNRVITSCDCTNMVIAGTTLADMFTSAVLCTSVDFSNVQIPNVTSMANMFTSTKIAEFDFCLFERPNVTNLSSMFSSTTSITPISFVDSDLSSVTTTYRMFYNSDYTSIDFTGADMSNVTTMFDMFYTCNRMTECNLTDVDASSVTNFNTMFETCTVLNNVILDGSTWGNESNNSGVFTSAGLHTISMVGTTFTGTAYRAFTQFNPNVTSVDCNDMNIGGTSLADMFSGATKITSVDFTNTQLPNVTSMAYMFDNTKITSFDFNSFARPNVTNMQYMFYSTDIAVTLSFVDADFSGVTSMWRMFGSTDYTSIDFTGSDMSDVTDMHEMFELSNKLTDVNFTNVDASSVTNFNNMFETTTVFNNLILDGSIWGNESSNTNMWQSAGLHTISMVGTTFTGSAYKAFTESNIQMTSCDCTDLNVTGTTLADMFNSASKITSVDFTNAQLPNVTSMLSMFYNTKIPSFDFNTFTRPNVTSMVGMFGGTDYVGPMDFTNVDFSGVTDMGDMFDLSDYTTIDFTGSDMSDVINMFDMFHNTTSLTEVNFTNVDCSAANDFETMFEGSGIDNLILDGSTWGNLSTSSAMWSNVVSPLAISMVGTTFTGSAYKAFTQTNAIVDTIDCTDMNIGGTSLADMFSGTTKLTSLNLTNIQIPNVTDMSSMFNTSKFGNVDFNSFTRPNVTTMYNMFANNRHIGAGDFTNVDFTGITTMFDMFTNSDFTSIDFTGSDMSDVNIIWDMFQSTSTLTEVNFTNVDCSSVTNFDSLFENSGIDSIILDGSTWGNASQRGGMWTGVNAPLTISMVGTTFTGTTYDVFTRSNSQVTSIDATNAVFGTTTFATMFSGDFNLTSLDVTGWDIRAITSMSSMLGSVDLDTISYTNMLTTFANQSGAIQSGITLDANSATYEASAASDKSYLEGSNSWTIIDGGQV
jgi:surface protein